MHHIRVASARRMALPLILIVAGSLAGCSVFKTSDEGSEANAETANVQATEGESAKGNGFAFSLQVRAPKDVREYLEKNLELQRFRDLPGLQERELSRLLGSADANARELLATLGYFSPDIRIELTPTPGAKAPRAVIVAVEEGERTTIQKVAIEFTGAIDDDPTSSRQAREIERDWSLPEGKPFTQKGWDGAKDEGLGVLRKKRFPTASIDKSRAEIDADTHKADLSVTYDSGPVYRFGSLKLNGVERYDEQGLRNIARLPQGDVYEESAMLDTQQRLASSGYFDSVFLTLDTISSDPSAATVTAQVKEAPLQKAVFGVGYSTDNGAGISLDHTHNSFPLIGWRALSKLSFDQKAQSIGTELTALPGENGWRWFTGGELKREETGSYQVNGTRFRLGRSQSTDHIDRNYSLQYDSAVSQGPMAPDDSSALSLNFGWTGRYFNDDSAPTRGWGIATEMGVGTTLRPERDLFTRLLVRGLYYQPLGVVTAPDGSRGHSRLQFRTEAGAVFAREGAQIPVTQLFLTGGDTTVRGYSLRAIGARTQDDTLFGGRYLGVASVEWQRPIVIKGEISDFESAVFIDAGAVADKASDLDPRVGVGAGVRWRSPVGPLQADLAYGIQAKALRLHLRLGFTF